MLLDRLMVALHHALEDEDPKEIRKLNNLYRNGQLPLQSPINNNLSPKYYKGKSEKDAYYGYKLLNGQAGDLILELIRCLLVLMFKNSKKKSQNTFTLVMSLSKVLLLHKNSNGVLLF